MKKLTLFSILILLVLLTAAWAPSALPALQPAAGQAAAAQQAATGTPTAATQAVATPLPALLTPTVVGPPLGGTAWIMSSLNGALPVPDTTVTLQLGTDASASGSDGCNRYWTTFEQDGQNLTFKPADGRDDDGVRERSDGPGQRVQGYARHGHELLDERAPTGAVGG